MIDDPDFKCNVCGSVEVTSVITTDEDLGKQEYFCKECRTAYKLKKIAEDI